MSDEDLLIKQTVAEAEQAQPVPQGRSGLQVPSDLIPVSLFGEFKDEFKKGDGAVAAPEFVEEKTPIQVPRGSKNEDIADFVWVTAARRGALRTVGIEGELNYYPLSLFKRFTVKISPIVGVTL